MMRSLGIGDRICFVRQTAAVDVRSCQVLVPGTRYLVPVAVPVYLGAACTAVSYLVRPGGWHLGS